MKFLIKKNILGLGLFLEKPTLVWGRGAIFHCQDAP
jgi:hypothetical protein